MNATNDSEVDSFHSGGSQFCFANGNLALVSRSGGRKDLGQPL